MLFFREPAAPVTIAPLKKNYLKPARLDMKGFVPKKKSWCASHAGTGIMVFHPIGVKMSRKPYLVERSPASNRMVIVFW